MPVVNGIEKKVRDMDPNEFKQYNANRVKEWRNTKKQDKVAQQDTGFKSAVALDEDEAKRILATHIVNRQVVEACYKAGLEAAQANKLVPNLFFWTNGLQKSLETRTADKEIVLELGPGGEIDGEVIHLSDLKFIFDLSVSWREPTSFEQFLAIRRTLKSDWYELGKFIGIPFEPKPHREWADFLPQWTPDLPLNYSMTDMRSWLGRQKSPNGQVGTREWLLMCSRNTMKSTASLALATSFVLCCPSARILFVSETTKLSKDFIKAFRGIWERGNNPAYERFQYFFPEFCIDLGDGKANEFTSPMRAFTLPQETAETASLEVAVAGRRADLQIFDDVISNLNTASDDQREKGKNTYFALTKLREAGVGISITIGTPWYSPSSGEVGDLYFELQKINDLDPDRPLSVLVQPAWILKPHARHKVPDHVLEITEDDIEELTCESRWTFKDLMKEARKNIRMFLSQNLVMYVESDDAKTKVQFDETVLRAHVRLPGSFDNPKFRLVETVMAVDIAYSVTRYADFSAIAVGRIYQGLETGKHVLVIVAMAMDRFRPSELAEKIVMLKTEYNPNKIVIEKSGSWQNLSVEIDNSCVRRGLGKMYNIYWKPATGVNLRNKVERVKALETLLNADQFYLTHSTWTELLIQQFIRFDGVKRSGSSNNSKDDGPDSCGLLAEASHYIKPMNEPISEAQEQMEFEMQTQRQLQMQHERIFGTTVENRPDFQFGFQQQSQEDPGALHGTLGRFGLTKRAA